MGRRSIKHPHEVVIVHREEHTTPAGVIFGGALLFLFITTVLGDCGGGIDKCKNGTVPNDSGVCITEPVDTTYYENRGWG